MDIALYNWADELAVVAAIGMSEEVDDGAGGLATSFARGEDCLECINDVERWLRRDNPRTRDFWLQLGRWRVLQTKLLPLVIAHRTDR